MRESRTSTPLGRFARRLRIGAGVVAVVLALATVAAIVPGVSGGPIAATLDFDGIGRGWGVAGALIVSTLIVFALLALMRMLRAVEGGDIFGPAPTRHFRRFAAFITAAALANLLVPVAGRFAAASAQGARALTLTASGADLLLVLLGVLLLLVARLFETAARYEEDSKAIV